MTDSQTSFDQRRADAAHAYPNLFTRLVSEWAGPAPKDQACLLYAANYLFHTSGIRWALDPLTLRQRIPSAPAVDISALAVLDYVVLTHRHADHFNLELLAQLKNFPIRWIVPEALLDSIQTLHLPSEKLTIAHPLEPIPLGSLTLTPFDGRHFEVDATRPGGIRGVPSTGYLAEFNGKRWLIPGDTRTYDASKLPDFGPIDGLFAHLWLGRGQALNPNPPRLDEFGRFCLALQPRRIVLTHLDEWGRPETELWTAKHANLAMNWFAVHAPGLPIGMAKAGDRIDL